MFEKRLIDEIAKIVGDKNISLSLDRLYAYPEDSEIILKVIGLAKENRFKIIPVGSESKIDYNRALKDNTLILSLTKIDQIKKVVPEDLYVISEPGVLLKDLNKNLEPFDLFYPFSDIQQKGTIGGSIGAGLKGMCDQRIVHTKDFTLALEVMLSTGEKLKTGARVFKTVTGYDLPRLFVNSWGSLGIITEVSLRLHPLGRKKDFENISFASMVKKKVDRGEDNPKFHLNQKIKQALDPLSIFPDFNF